MHDQPKFYPQRSSTLYPDGRSVRPQVNGTVARSQGESNDYFHTGLANGKEADGLPILLTEDTLRRGQERFNIYCAPCHSRVGNGMGTVVQRGYHPAATFHSTRLRDAPLGHFFQVMTNGYGAMPNYAAEVQPQDRWAIAAYIRALQLSQDAKESDVASGQRAVSLRDVQMQQGFANDFLDPWIPPSRVNVPPQNPAPSVPVPAASSLPVPARLDETTSTVSKPVSPLPTSHSPNAISDSPATKSSPDGGGDAALTRTPPKEVAPVRDEAAGKMIYMRNCAACHQLSRAGLPPNIPSLIGIVAKIGPERIRSTVMNGVPTGKPPMPAFTSLSADDIEDLIAFLKASN